MLVLAFLRPITILAIMLLLYASVPFRSGPVLWSVVITTMIGLVVFSAVFVHQLRRIRRSATPTLTGVEALILVFGTFIIQFAMLYVSTSVADPNAFAEPLNRVAGLYLSITVLSTVGFGDITANSDLARIVVSLQMIADLILIGAAVRVLTSTAEKAAEAQ